MRHIFSFLIFIMIVLSCNQNNNKQKELELKEKELQLKEKELALKEKSLSSDTTKNSDQKNIQTTKIVINHSDFKTFWADFKTVVLANNKTEVLKMTSIPFKDDYQEVYYKAYGGLTPLTCNSSNEFLNKYDKIFTSEVLYSIKEDMVQGEKSEYVLEVKSKSSRSYNLLFKKRSGQFKLSSFPYYE